ncbi:SpoIIE family protein phosphatase [Arenimonas composti]|uniref:HAMP domain-containing protein n=1 Tax=Arenimonas composti TR7-09 = DSM 18010 TaxID=1121013 RepID=A0A091BC11_9GAMM|nr:SpoIIE family protein phosphatase [Arenimonas composti]KFN49042.1 hypothetical protein P873_12580 [Arenimonas composti TR7-09 = DSM 18010]
MAALPRAQSSGPAVPWWKSLRTRLMLMFGTLAAVLLLAGFAAAYAMVQRQVVADAEARTRYEAQQSAERLQAAMTTVAVTVDGMARLFREIPMGRGELAQAMGALVQAEPSAIGGLLALEPGVLPDGAPMAWYTGTTVRNVSRDLYDEDYDVRAQGWYRRTLESDTAWWSDPYFNEAAGGVWMTTLNAPLRDAAGSTVGMVSLDVPVRRLSELLDTLRRIPGQRPTLIAPGGMFAVHSDPGIALQNTLSEYIDRHGREDLRPLERAQMSGEPLAFTHVIAPRGETRYSVFTPIGDTGWSLQLSLSHDAILADLRQLALGMSLAALASVALVSLLVRRLAARITVPLSELTTSAGHFAVGEFDWPVPHDERADEVGVMARALERARDSIRFQLDQIAEMAGERAKLQSELDIARDIQLAMLPRDRELLDAGSVVEAGALLQAAKAIGGDFYNYFTHEAGALWFVAGDVSDKGVPAALFMARTMTVLEVATRISDCPTKALSVAARHLVEGNDTCMFATAICGRLALATGDLQLASAGHEPPVRLHADGHREWLQLPGGPVLGIEEDGEFVAWEGRLQPGDTLLVYTDGVTEAFDAGDQAFGEARLLDALAAGRHADEQCAAVVAAVHAFAAGAPQSDDITVLAIRFQRRSEVEANELAA